MSWKSDTPTPARDGFAELGYHGDRDRGARHAEGPREGDLDLRASEWRLPGPRGPRPEPSPLRAAAVLHAVFDAAPSAVAVVAGPDYVLDYANTAFRNGFASAAGAGASSDGSFAPGESGAFAPAASSRALAGLPLAEAVPVLARLGLLDALALVQASGTVFTAPEVRVPEYGPAGRPAVLRVTCSPVRASAAEPIEGVLLHLVDTTDQAAELRRLQGAERRHRNAAVALQRALLPQRLTQPDDLRIAGCYLPAGEADLGETLRPGAVRTASGELQVGGDWYDVIPLGAGRTAFVMGDVMGRGVHAAAIMGQLRAAVRAYAAANLPPGELLLHLDRHAAELEGVAYTSGSARAGLCDLGALASCVYAVYDPDDNTLTYAAAGHPAPLLRRPDGVVFDLDAASGPPLGTGEWTWQEARVAVPADSYLAFYTDGLVERRAVDLDEQFARLREVFGYAPLVEPDEPGPSELAELEASSTGNGVTVGGVSPRRSGPVDHVRDALLTGMQLPIDHQDDVALLVVHMPEWRGERAELFRSAAVELVGGTEIAAHARAFASGVLRSWHLDEDLCDTGVLAVSELVANAAIHGRPPVRLRLRRTDRRLIVDVSDGDDHLPRRRLAEETDEDGRGIGIVASLAASWGSRQLPEGKSVWCEFVLGPGHGH
ncbi:SpoIIE family protein phosphatase [Actinospica durhamensis]|uniref:SpoIIE family protein phosphatase n=1 Tax=Actinospica durhamensis TaxID=1508375 RepID=A0A941F034_9ACTN|nr:SpoIIE family protein phosphatase [Actinospica durhamensis]MBR7837649.1 SpoIIE family protein phosphatase [Actinospica durhamensis]